MLNAFISPTPSWTHVGSSQPFLESFFVGVLIKSRLAPLIVGVLFGVRAGGWLVPGIVTVLFGVRIPGFGFPH